MNRGLQFPFTISRGEPILTLSRLAETPECWTGEFQTDAPQSFGHRIKLLTNMLKMSTNTTKNVRKYDKNVREF